MVLQCRDCPKVAGGFMGAFPEESEFYMDMEYYNKKSLLKAVQETKCPTCGSENWFMTDSCER